ncbi:hypothetical protein GCM10011361_14770 [Muriicola marianensis]|uniref:DUF4221 domain-containing protein n=2 Tax=Muriicola marianensis TaxID=1324801 RepID=A0ABQ1QXZ9_9FLAO|nr:hypothetical protein GCM10011361_14770 [Muriicola marianensis]
MEEEEVVLPDFRLIGENTDNVYRFSYDRIAGSGTETNLTQSLGVDPLYLTLRQVEDVVSFYSFSSGSFSLVQVNTFTGQSVAYPDFYTVTDERSITWGANSEDLIFLGNYSPKGSRDFEIRTLDPSDGSFTDLPIALNIQQAYAPLYYRQRLMFTYRDEAGSYKIGIFDSESRTLLLTLDFGQGIPNILIDDVGNIGILVGLGNSIFTYQVYDIEMLDQLSEIPFTLDVFLPPGPLQGTVFGSTLYYTNNLAQPSEVPFGPAYFDFGTNTNVEIDILGIVQQVESDTGSNIDLTAIRYYDDAEVFLVGYANADFQNDLNGGVLVISKTGQLLDRIPLSFVPTYFVEP